MPQVELDGRWSIGYEDVGTGDPVLFVHGMAMTRASWLPVLDGLDGYQRLVVDIPPHGSSRSLAGPTTMAALTELLGDFLRRMGHESAHVAGHSFGGALALRFAADFPEMTRSLVILNSNAAAAGPETQERGRQGLPRMAAALREKGMAALRDSYLNPSRNQRLPEDQRAGIERDFESLDPEAFARFVEEAMPDSWGLPHASRVQAPVLVILGTRDKEFLANHGNLVKHLRDVRVVRVEGAGHCVHLEEPAAFRAALTEFLRQQA
jgi:pimeloyl-ACP methyl ester carboxylesterase